MPLYEMMLVARVGESQALANMMKLVSSLVLTNGGIVRSFDNMGDRVLVKNLYDNDGNRTSVGRFIKLEFDGTPRLMKSLEKMLREQEEILRVNTNKMKESEYLDRAMKRLNQELSPFRDRETHDPDYIRKMWSNYTQLQSMRQGSTPKRIAQNLPRVAAFMKGLESGPEH